MWASYWVSHLNWTVADYKVPYFTAGQFDSKYDQHRREWTVAADGELKVTTAASGYLLSLTI